MGSAVPGLRPRKAFAEGLSGTVNFTTWPNYFAQENLDNFTANTGVRINGAIFIHSQSSCIGHIDIGEAVPGRLERFLDHINRF